VIGVKQRQDKLTRPLVGLVDLDAILLELDWIYHKGNAIQKLTLSCFFQNVIIKFLLIAFRDYVPSFSGSAMAVIDGIEP
jgi:hypothetical protein